MEIEMLFSMDCGAEDGSGSDIFVSSVASTGCTTIKICVRPDSVSGESFVRATLVVVVPKNYPEASCRIECSLEKTRGLDDMLCKRMEDEMNVLAENAIAEEEPCLIALYEKARDLLSENNSAGDCCICLESLSGDDIFRPNDCFHCMHRTCVVDWWRRCVVRAKTGKDFDLSIVEKLNSFQRQLTTLREIFNKENSILSKLESEMKCLKHQLDDSIRRGLRTAAEQEGRNNLEKSLRQIDEKILNAKKRAKIARKNWSDVEWQANELRNQYDETGTALLNLKKGNDTTSVPCPVCNIKISFDCVQAFLPESLEKLQRNDDMNYNSKTLNSSKKKSVSSIDEMEVRDICERIQKHQSELKNRLQCTKSTSKLKHGKAKRSRIRQSKKKDRNANK
eukprot:g2353.t1